MHKHTLSASFSVARVCMEKDILVKLSECTVHVLLYCIECILQTVGMTVYISGIPIPLCVVKYWLLMVSSKDSLS